MSKHYCHAKCGATCPPQMLMCRSCWTLVPRRIQQMVWKYFNPECPKGKAEPPGEWMVAAEVAVAAVRIQKALPVKPEGLISLAVDYARDMGVDVEKVLNEALQGVPELGWQLRCSLEPLQEALKALILKEETTPKAMKDWDDTARAVETMLKGPAIALPAKPQLRSRKLIKHGRKLLSRDELVKLVKASLNIEAGAEGGLYEIAERYAGVMDVRRKGTEVWVTVHGNCDRILVMGKGTKAVTFKLEAGSPPTFNARGVHARVEAIRAG